MECQVRDIAVHYEEVGSGRPLFMLHGRPSDHRAMLNGMYGMEPLFTSRSGWRRIYPDLPGLGRTRGADWITHQDHMLDIVLEFIDAIAPGERFVVAGLSYGGYLARGVVYQRSKLMDGLLLLVPSVETDKAKRNYPAPQVLVEDAEFLSALAPDEQDLRKLLVVHSRELLELFRSTMKPADTIDRELINRITANYAFTFDVDALPEPFPAPTLILTGRQDSLCGYREAWKILDNYPRGTFAVLDRAGHLLGAEQQNLFRALANEWLDRVEEYVRTSTHSR
jgi:pimeloyl-ACP methyl ester carboxylesterase